MDTEIMQAKEIESLKSEHADLRAILNDFGESIAHIKVNLQSLSEFNNQLSARQTHFEETQLSNHRIIESNSLTIDELSKALKQHFQDEMAAQQRIHDILDEFKIMASTITTIQLEAKDREAQALKERSHDLDKVYNRVRDVEKDLEQFKTQAAIEHAIIEDNAEKKVMDRVVKHVSSLWTVGLICAGLIAYIFNSHREDLDRRENTYKEKLNRFENRTQKDIDNIKGSIDASNKARILEHKHIFELGSKMKSNPYVEAELRERTKIEKELLKREHFKDGHNH